MAATLGCFRHPRPQPPDNGPVSNKERIAAMLSVHAHARWPDRKFHDGVGAARVSQEAEENDAAQRRERDVLRLADGLPSRIASRNALAVRATASASAPSDAALRRPPSGCCHTRGLGNRPPSVL